MSFEVRTDRTLIRAGARSTRYLLVSYTAPEATPRAERVPVNVALVLDRSGSMDGERKFELACQATKQALAMLRPDDRFTLVVFDTDIDTLARAQHATATAKRDALAALSEIGPRGGTDLCGGWMTACEALAEGLAADSVSRALLLTDGQANHGETDPERLALHASALRARGIATSTFGVGSDFDERLLENIAHEGGGNFSFIASAEQIAEFLTGELGEALETTVRGANLEITLPAGASATPLNRFRHAMTPSGKLRVQLGDLVSGQEVLAVVAIEFAKGEPGEAASVGVVLAGDGAQAVDEEATLMWTYATHSANDRQTRDRTVDREVAKLYAARARAEATEANRAGDLERARRAMMGVARRIESYAGSDTELLAVTQSLQEDLPQFEVPMDLMSLKMQHFQASSNVKGRDERGRARRRE